MTAAGIDATGLRTRRGNTVRVQLVDGQVREGVLAGTDGRALRLRAARGGGLSVIYHFAVATIDIISHRPHQPDVRAMPATV